MRADLRRVAESSGEVIMKALFQSWSLVISLLIPAIGLAGEQYCGSDERPAPCRPAAGRGLCIHRHHHSHSHCCCKDTGGDYQPRSNRSLAPAMAPRAMITESMPAMLVQPQFIAMPMYTAVSAAPRQMVAAETRSVSEPSCANSSDRLEVLERKVEMLDTRMRTMLDAMERQTDLLSRIKSLESAPAAARPGKE